MFVKIDPYFGPKNHKFNSSKDFGQCVSLLGLEALFQFVMKPIPEKCGIYMFYQLEQQYRIGTPLYNSF